MGRREIWRSWRGQVRMRGAPVHTFDRRRPGWRVMRNCGPRFRAARYPTVSPVGGASPTTHAAAVHEPVAARVLEDARARELIDGHPVAVEVEEDRQAELLACIHMVIVVLLALRGTTVEPILRAGTRAIGAGRAVVTARAGRTFVLAVFLGVTVIVLLGRTPEPIAVAAELRTRAKPEATRIFRFLFRRRGGAFLTRKVVVRPIPDRLFTRRRVNFLHVVHLFISGRCVDSIYLAVGDLTWTGAVIGLGTTWALL